MAFDVILSANFSKRSNSTKQPTGGTTFSGVLKEPCSLSEPSILIESNSASFPSFTYAHIPAFQRYYYITDIISVNGLWEVHMTVDVLATYKTQIGNSTEYVLRTDSTTDFNGEITDTTYPATTDVETETVEYLSPFTNDISVGCYIVGIISGGQSQAVGAISYYLMSSSQFGALKEKLFSDDNLEIMGIIDSGGQTLVQDLSQEVLKTLYNPYQYIASCMWFPFPSGLVSNKTGVSTIRIGWWDYPLSGYRVYAQTVEVAEQAMQFTLHPQATTRGSYLNYAPYSKRSLIGPYGVLALDSFNYQAGDTIDVSYKIDLITGQCRAEIGRMRSGSRDIMTERHFLLGVQIQIAQVGTDYLGTAISAINTVPQITGGAISGMASGKGAIMGAIAGGASGIYNTIQSAMPQVETSGSNGSFLSAGYRSHVVTQFYRVVDEDIAHRGRPLCELRQLNALSGFILCAEGDINISCFDNERREISRYLTTGFFWE